MEITEQDIYQIVAKIEHRDQLIEEQIRLNKELPNIFGRAIAEQIQKITYETEKKVWALPVNIDLGVARSQPQQIGNYPQGGDAIVYLPDSTGIGTLYLDNPQSHGFEMGIDYNRIRAPFTNLFLSNRAQSGNRMYLLVGRGEIEVRGRTEVIRSVLGRNQVKWYVLYGGDISAGSVVTVPVYAGVAGWRLYFGGGFISCNAEIPQRAVIEIQMPGYPYLEVIYFRYNLQGQIAFVEPSIVRIESDENMQILIYNDDIESHYYSLTLLGMEEAEI